jgi:hypothetical protein
VCLCWCFCVLLTASVLRVWYVQAALAALATLPTMHMSLSCGRARYDTCTVLPALCLLFRQDTNGLSYYQFEFTIEGPKFQRHNVAVLATQVGASPSRSPGDVGCERARSCTARWFQEHGSLVGWFAFP